MKTFVNVVRDPIQGKHYRIYALRVVDLYGSETGIGDRFIPCEATLTNFKDRLGEPLYNSIFHTLVEIADLLGFLSFKILATDGTLFPTNARYKGCTHSCKDCEMIEFQGIIDNVHQRILYRLADPQRIVMGKEIRVRVECPSQRFPPGVTKPKVEVLTLCLQEAHPDTPSIFNQIFGLQEQLQSAALDLIVKREVITSIVMGDSTKTDSFFFRCPKLLSEA